MRKRKLPESRYPRFRASDATHIESGNMCATSIRALEVHFRSDILDILLRMSACSAKASFTAILSSACRISFGELPGNNRKRSAAERAVMLGSGADVDGGITYDAG